jgi:hypothetical protein
LENILFNTPQTIEMANINQRSILETQNYNNSMDITNISNKQCLPIPVYDGSKIKDTMDVNNSTSIPSSTSTEPIRECFSSKTIEITNTKQFLYELSSVLLKMTYSTIEPYSIFDGAVNRVYSMISKTEDNTWKWKYKVYNINNNYQIFQFFFYFSF